MIQLMRTRYISMYVGKSSAAVGALAVAIVDSAKMSSAFYYPEARLRVHLYGSESKREKNAFD